MSSVKRLYFYLIALVTLGIFVAGIRTLLNLLFELILPGGISLSGNFLREQLSLGFAMIIIGGPLWYFFWRAIAKNVGDDPREIGSTARKLYLNFILLAASIASLLSAAGIIKWMLGGFPVAGDAANNIAVFLSSAITWYYHWRISETEGHPSHSSKTLRRWYIYIMSAWGIISIVVGLAQFFYSVSLTLPVWGQGLVSTPFWSGKVQDDIARVILGGAYWYFHWFYMAKGDIHSTLRQVYIYLLAITGSALTGLVSLTMALNLILARVLGAVVNPPAVYFQPLGWQIPTIILAAAVWAYHQTLAQDEAGSLEERRLSSRRVHLYIMSFLSLGTMVAGVVILIGLLWDFLINSLSVPLAREPGWWQKQLSLGLALMIVAVPIWWYYWTRVIKLCEAGGLTEWKARSRRIYLYVVIIASILGLAADLVNIIYQLLSGMLASNIGIETVRAIKWSIQSLIVAAPLLAYHWRIAREDQRRGAEKAAVKKAVSILAGDNAEGLVSRIEAGLGTRVKKLQYIETSSQVPSLSDEEISSIVEKVGASETARVMIVIIDGKVQVLPYEEK